MKEEEKKWRHAMTDAGISSWSELAKKIHMSRTTLQERRAHPSGWTLFELDILADVLNIKPAEAVDLVGMW